MTLTIDGQLVPLHPRIAALIALLVNNQSVICQPEYGCLFLDLSPHYVGCRPFDSKPLAVDRVRVEGVSIQRNT